MKNTYILVVMYYNEYDLINNQEFWSFDSIDEAKEKEQEIINKSDQKIKTLINIV